MIFVSVRRFADGSVEVLDHGQDFDAAIAECNRLGFDGGPKPRPFSGIDPSVKDAWVARAPSVDRYLEVLLNPINRDR